MSKSTQLAGFLIVLLFGGLQCSISPITESEPTSPPGNDKTGASPEKSPVETLNGLQRADRAKVALQRDLWKSKNVKDYDYVLDLDTMTMGIPPQSIEVSVRNGEPVRVRHYRKPEVSRLELIEFAFTIDRLFDNLDVITREQPTAFVLFDADFGFPVKAVYGSRHVIYKYEVKNFTPLTGKVK